MRGGWTLVSALGALLLCASSAPGAPAAGAYNIANNLNIPAAPLDEALNALAQQSDLQVLFSSALVAPWRGMEIHGLLTAEQALRKLLTNTGLQFEFVNARTVAITEAHPASTADQQRQDKDAPRRTLFGGWLHNRKVQQPANSQALVLEEVVVTATKRAENLQKVPMTVSVVSPVMLQAQNFVDTADLKRLVPDLQYTHGYSASDNHFGIRGITTQVVGQGLEQSVGVAFDGVPLARNVGSLADLVDIHSVEALKGPQGMLFGKNASAGLINIISNMPQLDKTESLLRVAVGSRNLQQYSGTLNLPLPDDAALRLTAWKFMHDGAIREVNTGQDMGNKNSYGARLKYRWQVSDALDVNLSGEWTGYHENGTGTSIRNFVPDNFNAINAGALIQAWELMHGNMPSDRNLVARGLAMPYYDKGHVSAYTGQVDYLLGTGKLTGIVSYRRLFSDDQYDVLPSDNPTNQRFKNEDRVQYAQSSEEIRYTSSTNERLRYVVGLFNFHMNLSEDQGVGLKVSNTPLIINDNFNKQVNNNNYAAFGEATFDLTARWRYIAGARLSTDKLSAAMQRSFLSPAPPLLAGFTGAGEPYGLFAAAATTSYHDHSWRTGLQYQLTPATMFYATASQGYKGPGAGYSLTSTASLLAASNNGVVKPEIAHGYEIGLKSQWFERRLTLNVAAYDETFDDFQASFVVPGPVVLIAIKNAKQARTTGIDLDAGWLVTPELNVMFNATYDNARYTDFKNASCYVNQTVTQGCVNGVQNLDGHRLAITPSNAVSLTTRYERFLSPTWRGYLQGNYSYRSGVVFSSVGDPHTAQGGYGLLNLTAGVNSSDSHWDISVYGNNVFDKYYVDNISALATGAFYINDIGYQDLRNVGIAVDMRF